MKIKSNKARIGLIGVIFLAAVLLNVLYFLFGDVYVVPVLLYHHFSDTPSSRADTVSSKVFDYQMFFLKHNGYHVIPLGELISGMKEQRRFPRNTVVVTIDDGNRDNFEYAFPILKKYAIPAMIFLSPEYFGQEGYLTIEQIKQMLANGIEFGDHTMSHAYLPDCTPEVLAIEVEESRKVLERELGTQIDYFAYPMGGFNTNVRNFVEKAGFKAALTTNRGGNRRNQDPFQLNRVRLSDKDNLDIILRVKLSGYYNFYRKFKHAY